MSSDMCTSQDGVKLFVASDVVEMATWTLLRASLLSSELLLLLLLLLLSLPLSCCRCRGSCFRPARLVAKYSQRWPRFAQRAHTGFSLLHLILETAHVLQLSRNLVGSVLAVEGWVAMVLLVLKLLVRQSKNYSNFGPASPWGAWRKQ